MFKFRKEETIAFVITMLIIALGSFAVWALL